MNVKLSKHFLYHIRMIKIDSSLSLKIRETGLGWWVRAPTAQA